MPRRIIRVRTFGVLGARGAPWDFNLRDLFRWCELLEAHGQGGGCEESDKSWTYENGFLFADRREAYVLETAGVKHWALERVPPGKPRNISNGLSIRGDPSVTGGLVRGLHPSEQTTAARMKQAVEFWRSDQRPDESTPHASLPREVRGFKLSIGGFERALTEALTLARQGGVRAPLILLLIDEVALVPQVLWLLGARPATQLLACWRAGGCVA